MEPIVSDFQVPLIVQRKRVKNINIRVTWDGKVVVSVPEGTDDEIIKRVLERRALWISKKLEEVEESKRQLRSLPREFVDGETIWFLGEPIILRVKSNGEDEVSLKGKELVVKVSENSTDKVKQMVVRWLQSQTLKVVREKVKKFAEVLGVRPKRIELRDWKRQWGSCDRNEEILRFNWRIVQLPESLVEYIVVHELVHLRYSKHGSRFRAALSEIVPDWRKRHEELKKWVGILMW